MTSSRLDTPGLNPEEPIPNSPFYSPETEYLQGPYSPIYVGDGLEINASTGTLTTEGGPQVLPFNLTLYCSPDGDDVNGDGTLENPWYSPSEALKYLSGKIIPQGVLVFIQMADGVYNFTSPIYLNHPNGERIFINGDTYNVAGFDQESLNSAGAGYDSTISAHILAEMQSAFGTQLYFTGCSGFQSTTGGSITIHKLLIVGDNTTRGTVGVQSGTVFPFSVIDNEPFTKAILSSSVIRIGSCGITNWKGGGVLANGGGINFLPENTENINLRSVTIAGNDDNKGDGTGFGGGVVACNGGKVFGSAYSIQNNTIGCRAFNFGYVGLTRQQQPYNYNCAVANNNGTIDIGFGNARGTVNSFAVITDGGWISLQNSNVFTTSQAGFVGQITGAGYIQARNAGGWLNPEFSPAADTIGNGLGYINTL